MVLKQFLERINLLLLYDRKKERQMLPYSFYQYNILRWCIFLLVWEQKFEIFTKVRFRPLVFGLVFVLCFYWPLQRSEIASNVSPFETPDLIFRLSYSNLFSFAFLQILIFNKFYCFSQRITFALKKHSWAYLFISKIFDLPKADNSLETQWDNSWKTNFRKPKNIFIKNDVLLKVRVKHSGGCNFFNIKKKKKLVWVNKNLRREKQTLARTIICKISWRGCDRKQKKKKLCKFAVFSIWKLIFEFHSENV